MSKDLNQFAVDRQNIFNNTQAIENIQPKIGFTGLVYDDYINL